MIEFCTHFPDLQVTDLSLVRNLFNVVANIVPDCGQDVRCSAVAQQGEGPGGPWPPPEIFLGKNSNLPVK